MTEIPKLVDCTTVGLFGPVSSGKTWLLSQWLRTMERSLTIDATSAFGDEKDFTHFWGDVAGMCTFLEEHPYYYRVSFHPSNMESDFEWCAQAIWQMPSPRWLVCDEVQRVCGPSMSKMMTLVCQMSRHLLLGFIGTAQRIAEVNKALTSSCRMVVLFYTAETRDLIAISDRWGREVSDAVTKLRPCVYDDATKTLRQAPECVVWVRGFGHKVISLGQERLSEGEERTWRNELQALPKEPLQEEDSLAQPIGRKELD